MNQVYDVPASPVLSPDLGDVGPLGKPVVAVESVAGVDLKKNH